MEAPRNSSPKPKGTRSTAKPKRVPSKFKKVSEEMAQWSALIGDELLTWPQVEARRLFGCSAYYRNGNIFAVLPATRDFFKPNQVAFKFPKSKPCPAKLKVRLEADTRVTISGTFQHWINFILLTDRDFRDFLEYCAYAHEDAK